MVVTLSAALVTAMLDFDFGLSLGLDGAAIRRSSSRRIGLAAVGLRRLVRHRMHRGAGCQTFRADAKTMSVASPAILITWPLRGCCVCDPLYRSSSGPQRWRADGGPDRVSPVAFRSCSSGAVITLVTQNLGAGRVDPGCAEGAAPPA
jgi:hypothetical protein